MTGCSSWRIEPKFPPNDWSRLLHGEVPINTSYPILFVGNTNDPVTPFRSAIKMSQRFTDAGVLEVQTEGHCSIATISLCAFKKIKNYLQLGTIPSPPRLDPELSSYGGPTGEWERCAADERPWKPFNSESEEQLHQTELEMAVGWKQVQANSDEILSHISPRGKVGSPHVIPHHGL